MCRNLRVNLRRVLRIFKRLRKRRITRSNSNLLEVNFLVNIKIR